MWHHKGVHMKRHTAYLGITIPDIWTYLREDRQIEIAAPVGVYYPNKRDICVDDARRWVI